MVALLQRFALALVLLLATLGVRAQESPKIDELMRKSGLWEQVGTLPMQVRTGAQQAREEDKARGRTGASDADYARLMSAIDNAFSADRMRRIVARELGRALTPADVEEVLAWLSSDLGQRLTKLEEQASAGDPSAAERNADRILEALPKPRTELLEKLIALLEMDARSADNLVNMTAAIVYGMTMMSPQADADGAVAGIRKRLGSQRPQMLAYFHRMSLASLAETYRSVSDEELERYVRFNETAAAKRYNDATSRAFQEAIAQGSLEIGRRMAPESKRPTQRL